jgi:hypothetical protein
MRWTLNASTPAPNRKDAPTQMSLPSPLRPGWRTRK